jgi:YD repeat-containing protein
MCSIVSYREVMRVRFTVRPDEDESGHLAVWDGAVNGWRSRGLADEAAATREAAALELQYDAHGHRDPASVRLLGEDQQQQVQRAEWVAAGRLRAWLRTDGKWYGVVEDDDGRTTYIPGDQLRPEPA